jgi:hypothetical protein
VFILVSRETLPGCGPDFPNHLLDGGDAAVLVAPVSDFYAELTRMALVQSKFEAVPVQIASTFADQSADAETADLLAALERANVETNKIEKICVEHKEVRAALTKFLSDFKAWENSRPWVDDEHGGHRGKPEAAEPKFPALVIPEGLPEEFADYLEGAFIWHNPAFKDKGFARQSWERLLELPPEKRHFKSTWAAFMLGRSWEEKDPEKAIEYFKQVRDLAGHRFGDSVGLATASLGLEARVSLHQTNYERAIELYLEQDAAGDPTAAASLVETAATALSAEPEALASLAKNQRTQRLLTAFVISRRRQMWLETYSTDSSTNEPVGHKSNPCKIWLEAVEAAGVSDVQSAEKLALAAYQCNEMDVAQRWIKRAPNSPAAQWLQVKLLLRAGKLEQAATLLERVSRYFPIEPPSSNEVRKVDFTDTLFVPDAYGGLPSARQVLGELGVLRLARREYSEALDALLNAGFWLDAAYVAERVLTLDELKGYVDRHWQNSPEEQVRGKSNENKASPNSDPRSDEVQTSMEWPPTFDRFPVLAPAIRENIRYLLARRLTRSLRGDEAREYYPAEWISQFDALTQALRTGWDESAAANQRAKALFEAALITRTNGMELLGTEVEPDWHVHLGEYEEGATAEGRATNEAAKVVLPSKDELRRAGAHRADPEVRFHYRYQAAFLAWEAAKLMPDNSDETARALWTAGCWLKARDPQTADIFYKALVRRNRKTALGAEADRRRWFPELDADGKIVPRDSKPAELAAASPDQTQDNSVQSVGTEGPILPRPDSDVPRDGAGDPSGASLPPSGYVYEIQPGDTLVSIARQLSVSLQAIVSANPGLNPTRLRVGQKIFIGVE